MKNQADNPVRKTNRLAVVSLVSGILSLLPYLPALIVLFIGDHSGSSDPYAFEKNTLYGKVLVQIINAIPSSVYAFGGILLGLISLIAGSKALRQINSGGNVEKGHRMAIIGRVLSVLGMIANIFVGFVFFLTQ